LEETSHEAEGANGSATEPAPLPELVLPRGTRRRLGDFWCGGVLCVAVVAVTLAHSYRLVYFAHAKEFVLSAAVAAAAIGLLLRGGVSWRGARSLMPLWLGLLVAVALALGPAFARTPWRVVEEAVRLGVLLLATLIAYDLAEQRAWRARLRAALVASAVSAALLGFVQYAGLAPTWFPMFEGNDQRAYSVFANQDLFGGYMALGLALVFPRVVGDSGGTRCLALRRALYLLCFAVLLGALLLSASRSAWLAAIVGMAAGCPWRQLRPRRVAVAAFLATALVAAAISVAPDRTIERVTGTFGPEDDGGHLRLWFWAGAFEMVRAAPISGVGLGNYTFWSPYYQGVALQAAGGERYVHNGLHTTDAHSEPLQLLAETGLVGALCCGWMLLRVLRRRGAEWGGLAASLTFALFNAGFHSAPHALAALLLACMLLARGRRVSLHERDSTVLAVVLTGLAGGLLFATYWTRTLPSWRLAAAENVHVAGQNPLALYERALEHPWPNPEAREEYGMALWERGAAHEAHEQFLVAVGELDTARLYLQLGRSSMEVGDIGTAWSAFSACLWRWPSNDEAWLGIYGLADDEERPALEAHARRWRIPLPADAADSV